MPRSILIWLQGRYAPASFCFGCGPQNTDGLQLRSETKLEQEWVSAQWQAQARYLACHGVVSGGVVGTLLDCHSNWAAAWFLALVRSPGSEPVVLPCTVTGEYSVRLLKPTPPQEPLQLEARLIQIRGSRVEIEAQISSSVQGVTARCRGAFFAVGPDHMAFRRW